MSIDNAMNSIVALQRSAMSPTMVREMDLSFAPLERIFAGRVFYTHLAPGGAKATSADFRKWVHFKVSKQRFPQQRNVANQAGEKPQNRDQQTAGSDIAPGVKVRRKCKRNHRSAYQTHGQKE
jgi:hypothetical protein